MDRLEGLGWDGIVTGKVRINFFCITSRKEDEREPLLFGFLVHYVISITLFHRLHGRI